MSEDSVSGGKKQYSKETNRTWTMGTKTFLHPLIPLLSRAWHICPPNIAGPKDLRLMLVYAREKASRGWPLARCLEGDVDFGKGAERVKVWIGLREVAEAAKRND